MKKKLLAMLLTLCMVTAMVAGLGVSAYAADDISADTTVGYIIPYKLASGDTVAKVCQKLGVDFSVKKDEITRINAITNYNTLAVGRVIWIPVSSVGTATEYYTLKAHTVSSGDTLTGICAQYGVSTGDALLSRLNNATISVGATLTVPVFKGDTKNAIGGGTAATTASSTVITTGTTATTTVTTTTVGSDVIAYYLIPYTMKAGDTVAKVCQTLGIDFAANKNLITVANNITSYATIPAGRTLLLPCLTVPVSGTCYKVMAHTLVAGDTMYKICQGYGISYANNLTLLKALNNSSNLNVLKVGNIVYIPVPATVTASAGATGSATVVSGTTGVTSASTSYYNVTKASAKNGSFSVKVAGAQVSAVAAGKTVTIVCNGADGYIQNDITVVGTQDSSKVVAVSNNTFVMPEFPVTVTVTFKQAPKYTLTAGTVAVPNAAAGTYNLFVNGAKLGTTENIPAGTQVTVQVKPADGYELKRVKVYKTTDSTKRTEVTKEGTFLMPSYNTTVEVEFQMSSSYKYPLNAVYADSYGTIDFVANKQIVNKAAAKSTVTVSATPVSGYKFYYLELDYTIVENGTDVTKHDEIYTNTFVVPQAKDQTDIKVTIHFIESTTSTITAEKTKNGTISFAVNGKAATKAEPGRPVQIIAHPAAGYELDPNQVDFIYKDPTTKPVSEYSINSLVSYDPSDFTFTMPSYSDIAALIGHNPANLNVIVRPNSTAAFIPVTSTNHNITESVANATVEYTVKGVTGSAPTTAMTGSSVLLHVTPDAGYRVKSIEVIGAPSNANKNLQPAVTNNSFTMPAWDVEVKIVCVKESNTVTINNTDATKGGVKLVNQTQSYVPVSDGDDVNPGDVIAITAEPVAGYRSKNITITYTDDDGDIQYVSIAANNTFVMPAYDITIKLEWADRSYSITKNPASNGVVTVIHDKTYPAEVDKLAEGEDIYIKATPNTGYQVKEVYYTNGNDKNKVDITSSLSGGYYTITGGMPGHAIKITAVFEEKTYELTFPTPAHGKLDVMVDGVAATSGDLVKYGSVITFATGADDGYVLNNQKVNEKGNPENVVQVTNNSFLMPDFNVRIGANYRAIATKVQLKKVACENGSFVFMNKGSQIEKADNGSGEMWFMADEGDTVQIKATPDNGYIVDKIIVTTVEYGDSVTVIGDSFTMPSTAVKIEVTFKQG